MKNPNNLKSSGIFRIQVACALSLIALVGTGCSTQDLERDLKKLERSVADLRSYQTEQTDTINSLDSQLKQLSGRIEEIEFATNKRLGTDLSALREDVSSLRRRVPPPSIVPASELEVDEVWGNSLQGEAGRLFLDALQRLRDGKFDDAIPMLQNAVEQLQGTEKAGVALFWQGVAYDGIDDTRGALRSYAEVLSQYPKSQRAASSLLRQSDLLLKLGDKKAAQLTLEKLLVDYPKSPESVRAKERLRDLR
jgi:TolA-binding protein